MECLAHTKCSLTVGCYHCSSCQVLCLLSIHFTQRWNLQGDMLWCLISSQSSTCCVFASGRSLPVFLVGVPTCRHQWFMLSLGWVRKAQQDPAFSLLQLLRNRDKSLESQRMTVHSPGKQEPPWSPQVTGRRMRRRPGAEGCKGKSTKRRGLPTWRAHGQHLSSGKAAAIWEDIREGTKLHNAQEKGAAERPSGGGGRKDYKRKPSSTCKYGKTRIIKMLTWDFPGNPVVETLCCQCRGHGVPFLVGELGSHMLWAWPKDLKNKKNYNG